MTEDRDEPEELEQAHRDLSARFARETLRPSVQAAETHAREAGVRWLRIGVMAENRAAWALYTAMGFGDRLVELGTYDPRADNAAEVVEYLEWLLAQGIDVMALAETTDLAHFGAASTAMSLRPDARPLAELGDLGIDEDRLTLLAAAFGFSAETIERGWYTPAEVEAIRSANAAIRRYPD